VPASRVPRSVGAESAEATYPIHSLAKGLDLLLLFRGADCAIRLSDASRSLGVSISTAHRLLGMLKSRGFVRQDPKTRAYFPGSKLFELTQSLFDESALYRAARDEMARLVKRVDELAVLAVLRGSEAHFIALVEGPTSRVGPFPEGLARPAHATAAGKMLLSQLSHDELRKVYSRSTSLATLTTTTIGRRRLLERELAEIRSNDYALSAEETRPDCHAVAVLIRSTQGEIRGALSLLSVPERMPPARVQWLVNELRLSAATIVNQFDLLYQHPEP
jgi:DNA-binding IclR family transcriptional regulator